MIFFFVAEIVTIIEYSNTEIFIDVFYFENQVGFV